MENEDVWSGPITKAARKAEKKAELELWQAHKSLDLRDLRDAWESDVDLCNLDLNTVVKMEWEQTVILIRGHEGEGSKDPEGKATTEGVQGRAGQEAGN